MSEVRPVQDMPAAPRVPGLEHPPVDRVKVFAIVAMALMMMSIDSTIVATALHALQHDLQAPIHWAGWTITAYLFGFVLMLPVSGKLSAQYGRRRVFLGSVLAFTLASLLCGLADSIYVLVVLRVLQAAGGAGFTPSATGIVVDYFGKERDRAVSLFGSIFPIGGMIGPIFGGIFVTYWNWRGIFLVNVPIGALILWLSLRHIPADPPRTLGVHEPTDFTGMALLALGLFSAMMAATVLGEHGAHPLSALVLVPALIAFVALGAFVRHIGLRPQPFVVPRLIYGEGFGAVNLVNAIFGGIPFGATALIPLYATNRYGIDALGAGTLLVGKGFAAIALSTAAAFAIRRTGYRLPVYVGGSLVALGMLLLAFEPPAGIGGFGWLAGAAFISGAGSGTLNPATRNAGLQLAPEQSSVLAALRTMSMQVGSILMVSTATAILAVSDDPGHAQAWIYACVALLIVLAMPLVRRIPEFRGAW